MAKKRKGQKMSKQKKKEYLELKSAWQKEKDYQSRGFWNERNRYERTSTPVKV